MEKQYTRKDYMKIVVIVAIITLPLIIAYGAAGYFEENGTKFWFGWDCDQMIDYKNTPDFEKIKGNQLKSYNLDLIPCLEQP